MSSPDPSKSHVRRSDPALKERPSKDPFRPFGLPRWIGFLLYGLFWVALLVPLVRSWRRNQSWHKIRLAMGAAGLTLLAAGLIASQSWVASSGGVLALAALMLSPVFDPDHERKLQARHGAEYLLNGGVFVSGTWPGGDIPARSHLYLLIKGRELLALPVKGNGDVRASLPLDDIQQILVQGEPYRPVYVSEAKDPPRREEQVDRSAETQLELILEGGKHLRFGYSNAFSKHLAETAAHAIYSVRQLGGADSVGGQSPEVFHVIGR